MSMTDNWRTRNEPWAAGSGAPGMSLTPAGKVVGLGATLAALSIGIAMLPACAGGGSPGGAPVVELSTAGAAPAAGGTGAATPPPPEPQTEVTVRPLGESQGTTSRPLGGSEPEAGGPATAGAPPQPPGPPPQATAGAPSRVPATAPAAGSGASASLPAPTAASSNPAVVTLLNTANAQVQSGELPLAAATLERALQIDPDSAWIWHRLAQVRLRQGQLDQTVSLASKSNSLAAGDPGLQADNWRLIADARRRQGAPAAAAAAEAQAKALGRP